jgi:hypothetical protein
MMVRVVTITIHAMMAHRTFVGLLTPVDLIEGTGGSDYRLQVKNCRSVECGGRTPAPTKTQ